MGQEAITVAEKGGRTERLILCLFWLAALEQAFERFAQLIPFRQLFDQRSETFASAIADGARGRLRAWFRLGHERDFYLNRSNRRSARGAHGPGKAGRHLAQACRDAAALRNHHQGFPFQVSHGTGSAERPRKRTLELRLQLLQTAGVVVQPGQCFAVAEKAREWVAH